MAVRFEGVPPHTDLARFLGDKLAPQINHFHLGQVQKRTMSGLEVYKARGRYPGLEMSYAYLHGQETLRIRVEDSLVRRALSEMSKLGRLRDYLFITLEMEDMGDLTASCAAFLRMPLLAPLPTSLGVAQESVGGYDASQSLRYPEIDTEDERTADGAQRSTLLVDLTKKLRGMPLSIDIYGLLTVGSGYNPQCTIQSYHRETVSSTTDNGPVYLWWETLMGHPEPFIYGPPFGLTYPDDYFHPPEAADPAYRNQVQDSFVTDTYAEIGGELRLVRQVFETNNQVITQNRQIGISDLYPDTSWLYSRVEYSRHIVDTHYDWVPIHGWTFPPVDVERPVVVKGTVLDQPVQVEPARWRAGVEQDGGECPPIQRDVQDFRTLEFVDREAGDVPGQVQLGEASISSGSSADTSHFNLKHICTLDYDAQTHALTMRR